MTDKPEGALSLREKLQQQRPGFSRLTIEGIDLWIPEDLDFGTKRRMLLLSKEQSENEFDLLPAARMFALLLHDGKGNRVFDDSDGAIDEICRIRSSILEQFAKEAGTFYTDKADGQGGDTSLGAAEKNSEATRSSSQRIA